VQYPGTVRRILLDGQHPSPDAVARSIARSSHGTQIMVNRVRPGGLACGLALLLAACGSGLSDNGPLGNSGQNSGTICYSATPGGVVHSGFEEFNDTGGTATVGKVALVHPRHLRLIAAWIAESNGPVAGVGRGDPHPSRIWQHVPGAVVHHTRGQEAISLVVVVKPTGNLGTATAVNMYYESAGRRYLRQFTDGYKIVVGRHCP
jgi:hypothetical protein